MIKQANYLGVVVRDVDSATAYFRDVLGLPVDESMVMPGEFAAFKLDGGAMFAVQTADPLNSHAYEPALAVENADAAYTTWKERGVEVLEEPKDAPYGRTFLFRTPEGHVFRAYQPSTSGSN